MRGVKASITTVAFLLSLSSARADDWNKDYSVSGKASIRLTTKDGDVEISSWDRNQVSARVTTIGYRIGPDDVRIEEQQSGDHLDLDVHVPYTHCLFSCHRSLKIELRVPRHTDLDLKTGDGNINGEDVQGDLRFDTGDGNVEFRNVDGALYVSTGDGNVRVAGRFDQLDMKTGDGNVQADASAGSKMSSAWSIRTGDGNVNLRIPPDLSADLEARTGDGEIKLNVPVLMTGSISKRSLHGKIKDGGPVLDIHTGDGDITISAN